MEEQKNNQTTEINEPVTTIEPEHTVESAPELREDKPEEKKEEKGFWNFFQKNFLAFSILVAGVLISSSMMYTNGSVGPGSARINDETQDIKVAEVSEDDDPFLGKKNAPVVMIEFSDFQCPFCRTWWKNSFEQLKKEYIDTGKVKFIYRDYPLAFHAMAESSALASECADDQGRYWEFHDKIFSEQEKLGQGTVSYTVDDIKKWAVEIGLNSTQFNQCLDSGKYKDEVGKDFADGSAAGVSGTPSFFINGRLIVGAQPYVTFKSLIEQELNK